MSLPNRNAAAAAPTSFTLLRHATAQHNTSASSTRHPSLSLDPTAPSSENGFDSDHDPDHDHDHDFVMDDGIEGSKPPPVRRRVVQSCSECRRRKIKCDRKYPCSPCILRGDPDACHEVIIVDKPKPPPNAGFVSTADHIALSHRVDALQHALLKSGAILPADIDDYLESIRASIKPDTSKGGLEHSTATSKYGAAVGDQIMSPSTLDETEGAALTLEHLAFGRSQVEGSHAIPHFGSRQRSSVSRLEPENNYHLRQASHPALDEMQHTSGGRDASDLLLSLLSPSDILDAFWKRNDLISKTLSKLLPSKEVGEVLVNSYIHKVLWLHRCIHVPTFLKQCNDLWATPHERVVEEFTYGFISIYFVVCCLGLQFMDAQEAAKLFSPSDVETLPHTWYKAARMANWAADFFGLHTLESVQCLIIMMVYMNNQDRADAAWAFLGGAIKMAQNLGLSRLGAETNTPDGKLLPMWTGRWESVIQREVGRRVWWNLVFLDWTMGFSHGFSTSIHVDQIKTAFPANVNDEDIVEGSPLVSKPKHVRTIMSYSLARNALAAISHRQIVQANNNPNPPYNFILSVDQDMQKAMTDIPASFKTNNHGQLPPLNDSKGMMFHYEKMGLQLAFHGRMLRLHRPFLSRGYSDDKFAFSKNQCIRAARAALRLMSANDGTASFLEKWWIALFYVSISGLVLIVDLLRTARKDMHTSETDQKIMEIRGALDQMRSLKDFSNPSQATIRIMDFLLAEVEERRKRVTGGSLGKRRVDAQDASVKDEDHALQEAVQKLVEQAALEATDNDRSRSMSTDRSPISTGGNNMDYITPPLVNDIFATDGYVPFVPDVAAQSVTYTDTFNAPPNQSYFNPAIENIVSSFLSGVQQQTGAQQPGLLQQSNPQQPPVTDDFLLRALSFSWDAPNMGMPPLPNAVPASNSAAPNQGLQDFGFGIESWNANNNGWMG